MCPDQQLLSIYLDGELPSPWKEKMESHLKVCSVCMEKLETFKHLHDLFKKDNTENRKYVERIVDEPEEARTYSTEEMQAAKERVWGKLESKKNFTPARNRLWRRRVSIPLPAAAAAAVILAIAAMLWIRGGQASHNAIAGSQSEDRVDFILASEDEIPGIMPVASDLNGVLQYLGADGSDIIILKLPESRNFSRAGEPSIIRAADYQRKIDGR